MTAGTVIGLLTQRPLPVNNLFTNSAPGRGRRKSKTYRAWCKQTGVYIPTGPRSVAGPIAITYEILRYPDKRRRDLFNLEKAFSDLLVQHAVIYDDSLIQRGVMQWADDFAGFPGFEARFTIEPIT